MRRLVVRVALVLAAVGLWQWNGALAAEREAARHQRHRIGRLVSSEERDEMLVAAVSVEHGDERWLYGRLGGLWRNLDHHQAAASESAISGLVDAILQGEGVVQSDDPTRFGDYGIGTPDGWRVVLHGTEVLTAPDRDALLSVDVGLPVEGLDGCFVKRSDRDVVWALDTDPYALLSSAPDGLPPLLEPTLLPASWPGARSGIRGVGIDRRWDGVRYGLDLRRDDSVTPAQLQKGASPYTWILQRPDGSEQETIPILGSAYSIYLRRARWSEVVDPRRAKELGLDLPAALVQLVPAAPAEGAAPPRLDLVIGSPMGDGRWPVFNTLTENLFLVEKAVIDLLVPRPELLLPGAEVNPWALAMEAEQAEMEARMQGFGLPGR